MISKCFLLMWCPHEVGFTDVLPHGHEVYIWSWGGLPYQDSLWGLASSQEEQHQCIDAHGPVLPTDPLNRPCNLVPNRTRVSPHKSTTDQGDAPFPRALTRLSCSVNAAEHKHHRHLLCFASGGSLWWIIYFSWISYPHMVLSNMATSPCRLTLPTENTEHMTLQVQQRLQDHMIL